jgi:murein DD-endopeptidase MepM/ murein hydrolase activator NlpD
MRSRKRSSTLAIYRIKGLPSVGRPFVYFKGMKYVTTYIALIIILFSCQGTMIDQLLRPTSPYEKYLQDLNASTLKNSGMVKDWISAGESVLRDSNQVGLPYQELTQFDPAFPQAASFLFSAREGQQVSVSLIPLSDTTATYFMDLFEIRSGQELKPIKPDLSDYGMTYPSGSDASFLLRVQPELLKGGLVEISIGYEGTLGFPVLDKTHRNIASFFGAPRDGGRRTHEGVDVFAPRGTPVVAVGDGRVTRVGTNRLGGNTVSVSSGKYSFYYAHLDSQFVTMGKSVRMGDTLGTVGNTGNAITTAPHLHFGIYASGRRSVDPIHFFRGAPILPPLSPTDTSHLNAWVRVKGEVVNLREGPTTNSPILDKLAKHDLLMVEGKTKGWLRIRLPDARQGFIAENLVETASLSLAQKELGEGDFVKTHWNSPEFQHPLFAGNVDVMGKFGEFDFIKTEKGAFLWVRK